MIENLKIIKVQVENEQVLNNQGTKNSKKNVSVPKQNNVKQKNKAKTVSNPETCSGEYWNFKFVIINATMSKMLWVLKYLGYKIAFIAIF